MVRIKQTIQSIALVTTILLSGSSALTPVAQEPESTTEQYNPEVNVVIFVPEILDDGDSAPSTLYEQLSDEEINLLEVVIQHEVGGLSREYRRLIAELIYNRLMSDEFPDSVQEVLYQENQFCGIEYWYSPQFPVDKETEEVIREVFSKKNTSHDATYYYNPTLSEHSAIMWFEYSGDVQYEFEYTEKSWGIEYTTRFFK